MATASGYVAGGAAPGGPTALVDAGDDESYWTLEQCKEAVTDYLGSKREEQEEVKQARRYRHGSQYTAEQIAVLNKRKQPVVTYNRVGRKIDGIVGFVERLKQDPKAYPRTPKDQASADLATAALRFVCDQNDWKSKTPAVAEGSSVDGYCGIELDLKPTGDAEGDYDVCFNLVSDGYFYDASSVDLGFEDSSYDGVTRWLTKPAAKRRYPQYAEEIEDAFKGFGTDGDDMSLDTDRDNRWFSFTGKRKRMRFVELWYQHNEGYCWCVFTGSKKLDEGPSPWYNAEGEQISRYIMFSCAVDHDGDRYGFVRNLKSAQDEINQRRSKGLHILNTRRIQGEIGAFPDVEAARREAARPDGVILRNKGFVAEFEDAAKQAELNGQFQFLEDAKNEIDNYGPSQVVTGEGVDGQSGRAIALRQQAAVAELGPFVLSYRGWKIRVYRALFCAVQRYWTAQRWIRVTDDENVPQFIAINAQQVDPMTGQQQRVNPIGELDVDIILDEGPDTINAMADTFEALKEIIPPIAPMLSPPKANAVVDALFASSALPGDIKKKVADISAAEANQPPRPDPEVLKLQAEQQKSAAQIQFQREKGAADIQLAREKAGAEMQLKAQQQAFDQDLEKQKLEFETHTSAVRNDNEARNTAARAEHEMHISQRKAEHEANLRSKESNDKHEREVAQTKEKASASHEPLREVAKEFLDGLSDIAGGLSEKLSGIEDALSAPRVMVRGKDGRPERSVIERR